MRRCRLVAALLLILPSVAQAERPEGVCMNVSVEFTPTDSLQIVGWLEKPDGTFVDTVFVTNKVGRYGIGNRPGRGDLNTNSATHDTFPYGRREQTFPVWAHRHGKTFPKVVFQTSDDEGNVSRPFSNSSPEISGVFTRPILPAEDGSGRIVGGYAYTCTFDAGTCASVIFSDKGKFDPNETSLYPPRADLSRNPGTDSAAVELFRANNPFDAVSHATPPGGMPATMPWAAPQAVDFGEYVLYIETSKTYDFNGTYNDTTYPSPEEVRWNQYGLPWRGQPSVVYKVPVTFAQTPTQAIGGTYVGYGDPDGATGTLHAPDATITTDTPGSGASRLQLVSDNGTMFRIRVNASTETDPVAPADLGAMDATNITGSGVTLSFTAPGDDVTTGSVAGYEVRLRAGSPITEENFADSAPAIVKGQPVTPGELQTLEVTGMLPETEYYVGVRAYDNCFNRSPLATIKLTTADRTSAEIPWCFVATAAYGSTMATEVGMLRRFRDGILERSVLGELAVETYYTFGPPLAGVVGSSEILRATARGFLAPIVATVGRFMYR
jgi:hypothetical protein